MSCRWPKCEKAQVPGGAMWGCMDHWKKLPPDIRQEWASAITDAAHIAADKAAQEWIWSNRND